ncbi:hypothetical protein [Deinococcus marmoris]|uniref:hypothetical protein n=1 Tax=Deinococcus marmoris TaxID=249408 RepID=UPI0004975570|nr:hypothetical protein [Deinococcus marmoris]
MKKTFLIMTALLIGGAAAIRGEKRSLSMPQWIADYSSLDLHGAGAPINWAAFTDAKFGTAGRRFVPSGTTVSLVAGKIVPADGTADTLLMMSDAREDSPADSISGYGLVTAGNVYEAQLPDSTGAPAVLATPVRTKAARFYFQ